MIAREPRRLQLSQLKMISFFLSTTLLKYVIVKITLFATSAKFTLEYLEFFKRIVFLMNSCLRELSNLREVIIFLLFCKSIVHYVVPAAFSISRGPWGWNNKLIG